VAVLIAVLLPTLGRARERAKITVCGSNLRTDAQAVMIYAAQWGDRTPQTSGGGFALWDVPFGMRDAIVVAGSGRKEMYCPSNLGVNVNSRWNFRAPGNTNFSDVLPTDPNYGTYYGVIGYVCFLKRPATTYPTLSYDRTNPPIEYKTRVSGTTFPAQAEMFMDLVASNRGMNPTQFVGLTSAGGNAFDTSHMLGKLPFGANTAYMDGHVDMVKWGDMDDYSINVSGIFYFIPGQ
jgi:prepilin-type processing-associated H-X9-DG protein